MNMSLRALRKKYMEYLEAIHKIGFASSEYDSLPKNPETDEELIEAVGAIIDTSRELNQIIEQSPSSIYVADTDGKTLRINYTFEETTGLSREALIGRTTSSIEEDDLFNPSVCSIVLKEKRKVILPQVVNNDREFVVAGVPIIDENGEIFRVITNSLLNNDTVSIGAYFRDVHNNEEENKTYPALIAVSEGMQNVVKLADMIKDTQSTILIEGETGVGKSLLARYIHYTSERCDKKMTEINCGAIPPALLESELFGYVSGAFTGADKKGKAGLVEISDGGTILLDEISEMPIALQVKLLHFLQNKKITRVGGTEEIPVDVRVIAATNKTLENLVESGEFREDLFYRLNVVPIVIPPLRERKADIMPAVNYFADKYTKLYDKKLTIEDKCVRFFEDSYWKGNLRELENCVERLVVTEGEVDIDLRSSRADIQPTVPVKYKKTEGSKIDEAEKKLIIEAYNKHKSSYKVAKELGISQSSAYRKIQKYIKKT